MELLIVLLVIVALDLAAMRWGCDSTEPMNSHEWEKRLAPPFVGKSKTSLRHGSSPSEWEKRLTPPFAGHHL